MAEDARILVAIKCKNPSCPEKGRVLGETDGPRLYVGPLWEKAPYMERATAIHCPACRACVVWVPTAAEKIGRGRLRTFVAETLAEA